MIKGSRVRKCLICQRKVGWLVPSKQKDNGFWGKVASAWQKNIIDTEPNVTLQFDDKQVTICSQCNEKIKSGSYQVIREADI